MISEHGLVMCLTYPAAEFAELEEAAPALSGFGPELCGKDD